MKRAFPTQICQVPAVAEPAQPIPGRRLLVGLLIVFLAAVIPGVVVPTLMCRPEEKQLPDLGSVPGFTLVDQLGQPFSDVVMHGKVSIVSFVFTRCDTICPVISMKMARIQDKTFDIGRDLKLVSFSVDPAYDTPERLAAYAKKYGANPERWRLVTGPYDAVYKLIEGPFMTSMMRVEDRPTGAPDIKHGGYFMLLDKQLHIRGIYDSNLVNQLDALMHDARYLVRTSR
ncbi:MAG TPA: SCO family protein [Kofleriaceae bacterium]